MIREFTTKPYPAVPAYRIRVISFHQIRQESVVYTLFEEGIFQYPYNHSGRQDISALFWSFLYRQDFVLIGACVAQTVLPVEQNTDQQEGDVLSNGSIEAIHRSFNEFGYSDELIKRSWVPHSVLPEVERPHLPLTAFWGHPFDQFRSAVTVVEKNGVPTKDLAKGIALRTLSHVLLCDDEDIELWLLDSEDIKKHENRVPISQIESLVDRYGGNLERSIVVSQKIRLRQYALYEADPKGQSFGQWAVRPSIEQASANLSKLVAKVVTHPAPGASSEASKNVIRWLFRVLALRVGKDRNWDIASDLGREAVSEFAKRAEDYPRPWPKIGTSLSINERSSISERVLETLNNFDFSTVDPIFIVKAFGSPALKQVRADIDLFPTPRPYAWDMMASIPLREGMGIHDPTIGTGTFLVAAGHAFWARCSSEDDVLPQIRDSLHGTDKSSLSTDLSHITLDLAFGWNNIGWQITEERADLAVSKLSRKREWILVGNLPWSGRGRSQNQAAKILALYVDILSKRDSGWIATIVPRSVWTSRDSTGDALRKSINSNFQIESAWELPWDAIKGGRAQSIATVLSRGQPPTTTVWNRQSQKGVIHTIGYSPAHQGIADRFFPSSDARYLKRRLANYLKLQDYYNIRVGIELNSPDRITRGNLPFMRSLRNLEEGETQPDYLATTDIKHDSKWAKHHFTRQAYAYRNELRVLPQVAVPRHIYEGPARLRAMVFDQPMLLSKSFLICTPRIETTMALARGIATILVSSLGRLWLYLFASAGRHLSNVALGDFPLPDKSQIEKIATTSIGSHLRCGSTSYELISPHASLEHEFKICASYGFDEKEQMTILALTHILGYNPAIPRTWIPKYVSDSLKLRRMTDELENLPLDSEQRSHLYLEILSEREKDEYWIIRDEDCQLSIDKSEVVAEDSHG